MRTIATKLTVLVLLAFLAAPAIGQQGYYGRVRYNHTEDIGPFDSITVDLITGKTNAQTIDFRNNGNIEFNEASENFQWIFTSNQLQWGSDSGLDSVDANGFDLTNLGDVGVGIDPESVFEIATDTTARTIDLSHYDTGNSASSHLRLRKSASDTRGTVASTATGDVLGNIDFLGVNSAGTPVFDLGARIIVAQDGSVTSSNVPAKMTLSTWSTSGSNANQLVLSTNSNIGFNMAAPLKGLDSARSARIQGTGTVTLTGTIDPAASTTVDGVGTLFLTELVIGDQLVVTGENRTVKAIASNIECTVDQAFTDNANDTSPDKIESHFVIIDSGGTTDFVIDADGNTGWGTSAPVALIHAQTAGVAGLLLQAGSGFDSLFRFRNGSSSKWAFGNDATDDALVISTGSNLNSPVAKISSAGDVFIENDIVDLTSTDVMYMVKTVVKTIDLNDDGSTDDFQFDDDATNSTAQNVDMGAIIPAFAEVVSVQIRCFETVGAGTFQVTLGTASAGAELLAQTTLDAANEIDATATGAGPKLEAANAAKNVWIQGDPSGNWSDAGDAGRWAVFVSYIDYGATYTQKNP